MAFNNNIIKQHGISDKLINLALNKLASLKICIVNNSFTYTATICGLASMGRGPGPWGFSTLINGCHSKPVHMYLHVNKLWLKIIPTVSSLLKCMSMHRSRGLINQCFGFHSKTSSHACMLLLLMSTSCGSSMCFYLLDWQA